MWHCPNISSTVAQQRLLSIWSALCVMSLLGTSLGLWIEPSGFPSVPAFALLVETPWWVDRAIFGLLLVLLGTQFASSLVQLVAIKQPCDCWQLTNNACRWLLILLALVSVSLNQHRCQAWFYYFTLLQLVLLIPSSREAMHIARYLVISVYIYSALGKLDYQFAHTSGQDFLNAIAKLVFIDVHIWSASIRAAAALLLPLVELTVGVDLLFKKHLFATGLMACLFHLGLIACLGPWNLGHSWSVILWNVQFLGQAVILFVMAKPASTGQEDSLPSKTNRSISRVIAYALLSVAFVMPLGERWGVWDHWPSWALYAPHCSRAEVFVASHAWNSLPPGLLALMEKDEANVGESGTELWQSVPISRWSLSDRGVPIYPQDRFQIGVALAVSRCLSNEYQLRIVLLSSANRFTGEREWQEFVGVDSVEQLQADYWFNIYPRGWHSGTLVDLKPTH